MKPPQALLDKWEAILAEEGLAEVSLFDNTGKTRGMQFVSSSAPMSSDGDVEVVEWIEYVNIENYGEQVKFQDLPQAQYARKLAQDVASLPTGWPKDDIALLMEWAESGSFLGACKLLGVGWNDGRKIRARFEAFIRDSQS